MDHTQRGVTVTHLVRCDDANGDEVVNLIEIDLLRPQFLPDLIEPLHPSLDADKRHYRFGHLLFDTRRHDTEKRLVLRAPFFELFREFAIVFGMKMAKGKVLKLAAQLTHSESMRNWRKDLHRLFRDALALLSAQILKRAHVVQTICQLYEHDAHVVDHREQHLAHVLRLLLFT